ncbi:MAG: GAF domain-containing sensor histidine kinase [Anaerolineaceae bacterium]|nr:GAF domain-containing sensor histidine kinase [Anaerolineaceae bacterium]
MTSKKPNPINRKKQALPEIIDPLLFHIKSQVQAGGCLILLRDPKTGMFQIVANTDQESDSLGSVVRPNEDMVSRVALHRQPMIVNNYREWTGRSVEMRDDGFAQDALLCVPLLWEDRYLGGLVVTAESKRRQFTDEDIPKLVFFSSIISALLQHCKPQDFQQSYETRLSAEVEEEIHELRKARKKIAEDADKLRAILADTVAIQENERSRIASDLHDGSNQLIVGAIYEIQVTKQRLANNRIKEASESLDTVKSLLRRIEADIRMLISDMRPVTLISHGLVASFKWYLHRLSEKHGFKHHLHIQGTPKRLPSEIEIVIFRIVQEALNNAIEHAKPHLLQIRLTFQAENLVVIVQDDGEGFDPQKYFTADNTHFGLISMRERALSIGARIEVTSTRAEGTRLTLHIPLLATPEDPLGRLEQLHSVQVAYTEEENNGNV